MRQPLPATPLDPALAVSALLTRLGLFMTVILAPVAALISRRVAGVLIPIGAVLLILASALEGKLVENSRKLRWRLVSPPALFFLVLLVWAGFSLAWTLRSGMADRLISIIALLFLYLCAAVCVPDRIRSSNANLAPIGAALATALFALTFSPPLSDFLKSGDVDRQRAAILLVLLAWPGLAVFAAKGRWLQTIVLGVAIFGTLWLLRDLVILSAFLAGALAFFALLAKPRISLWIVAGITSCLLLFAPLISLWLAEKGGFLLPAEGDRLAAMWREVSISLPTHFFRGFGFEASGALQRGNGDVLGSPRNAALQIWLELGLVGIALAFCALLLAWMRIRLLDERIQPAVTAIMASVAALMFSGLASWQNWWLTTLGAVTISLTFVTHWLGQRSAGRLTPSV